MKTTPQKTKRLRKLTCPKCKTKVFFTKVAWLTRLGAREGWQCNLCEHIITTKVNEGDF